MAVWSEEDRPAIYDGLGEYEFTGWAPRPSVAARLFGLGVGVACGVALGFWLAPVVARWLG